MCACVRDEENRAFFSLSLSLSLHGRRSALDGCEIFVVVHSFFFFSKKMDENLWLSIARFGTRQGGCKKKILCVAEIISRIRQLYVF